jgi:hypothetical protein
LAVGLRKNQLNREEMYKWTDRQTNFRMKPFQKNTEQIKEEVQHFLLSHLWLRLLLPYKNDITTSLININLCEISRDVGRGSDK